MASEIYGGGIDWDDERERKLDKDTERERPQHATARHQRLQVVAQLNDGVAAERHPEDNTLDILRNAGLL